MARKKKNDFWDDVDDVEIDVRQSGNDQNNQIAEDEEWSAAKSLPLKIVMRFLLMVACLVALGSAYIAYEYVGDRYAGGSYSTDFFNSGSFAAEYNKSVDQLLQLVQAMEADPSVTAVGNEELLTTLVENYMGKDTNFSFMILDRDRYTIARSGEDAKDRIETSSHWAQISSVDGETTTQSTIPGSLLDKDKWNKTLSEASNTYIIYSSVDNELTQVDSFYKANQAFEKMEDYFGIARFVGIIAAVIFVICLIFCIMSTGMKRGYDGVCLSWFDKVFTEIALVIMVAVAGGLVFAIRKLMTMDGSIYQYASIGLVVVTYGWIIRSYFSIVRRIKAGRLLRCSMVGTVISAVSGGIGKLPSPFNVIVGALILLVINGALVYGVIFMRQYTVKGIPVMFIAAPIVFVIELLALLLHGGDSDEEEEDGQAEDVNTEASSDVKISEDKAAESEWTDTKQSAAENREIAEDADHLEWEAMDLGKAIEEAEKNHAYQMRRTVTEEASAVYVEPQKTVGGSTEILSVEAVEKAIRESGLMPQIEDAVREETIVHEPVKVREQMTQKPEAEAAEPVMDAVTEETVVRKIADIAPEDDGRVNFVQLNKDVRKEFKAALKSRGIGVTVRAPEKPVIIDIDHSSLHIIIADIFSQIERLSANDARTYVEIYLQGGKVVYIAKIPVSAETREAAQKAVAGDGSFESARKIIEANDGRFVVTLDGDVLKAGILIDAAE